MNVNVEGGRATYTVYNIVKIKNKNERGTRHVGRELAFELRLVQDTAEHCNALSMKLALHLQPSSL